MGALAFSFKDHFDILLLSDYMEAAVGITLIIIGCMGLRKAKLWRKELQKTDDPDLLEKGHSPPVTSLYKDHDDESSKYRNDSPHHLTMTSAWGILSTGIFHGFSGSGHFLGVMPALLLPRYATHNSLALFARAIHLRHYLTSVCVTCAVGAVLLPTSWHFASGRWWP
jgi:ABC-type nickel/cobalt efflux system permease component RcnA